MKSSRPAVGAGSAARAAADTRPAGGNPGSRQRFLNPAVTPGRFAAGRVGRAGWSGGAARGPPGSLGAAPFTSVWRGGPAGRRGTIGLRFVLLHGRGARPPPATGPLQERVGNDPRE